MKLENVAQDIRDLNVTLRDNTVKAINKNVTARNWLIGYCIVNYEQNGDDRARYGEKILQSLSEQLNDEGLSYRNLRLFRQFYLAFPELGISVLRHIQLLPVIWQSPIAKLQNGKNELVVNNEQSDEIISSEYVFSSLSYTHLLQLLYITDPLEKAFYEIEAINGIWSFRELKRQIDSQLYFRTGLSNNKAAVLALANKKADVTNMADIIRSPYTFEFLGLRSKDVVEESELESALIDHLQEFILELGNGFCFEARQKRVLIDEKYFFYDLLFYNRNLHCGVIVELKTGEMDYADLAQLNMYVNYYRKNLMNEGDNPPIGILLCSSAGSEMVEYASPGIDRNVFVSTYMMQIPDREILLKWLKENK